ncbi:hypothetical protein DSO57_1022678 [Entomophthora muscae]|uniref:Uncharacterized protein n=1 Tax=Entomophthora muscae TaxID=34485 RepID=A0ACC2SSC1_9FUNG|nr:hypothetical protein DSO57_1022678 [Entomophthora muscae]
MSGLPPDWTPYTPGTKIPNGFFPVPEHSDSTTCLQHHVCTRVLSGSLLYSVTNRQKHPARLRATVGFETKKPRLNLLKLDSV